MLCVFYHPEKEIVLGKGKLVYFLNEGRSASNRFGEGAQWQWIRATMLPTEVRRGFPRLSCCDPSSHVTPETLKDNSELSLQMMPDVWKLEASFWPFARCLSSCVSPYLRIFPPWGPVGMLVICVRYALGRRAGLCCAELLGL